MGLVKEPTRLRNRRDGQTTPIPKRRIKARPRLVERQLAELYAEIARQIASDEAPERQRDILRQVPGLGPVAAALVLTLLPEIGTLTRAQVASLAPHVRGSGQWKGRSFIGGGRKPLRHALYMPALVAMRFNPDLRRKHAARREGGKPAKVALLAFGGAAVHWKAAWPASPRRLLETASALVKADRLWTPEPA